MLRHRFTHLRSLVLPGVVGDQYRWRRTGKPAASAVAIVTAREPSSLVTGVRAVRVGRLTFEFC
jgi:hypothetical protein